MPVQTLEHKLVHLGGPDVEIIKCLQKRMGEAAAGSYLHALISSNTDMTTMQRAHVDPAAIYLIIKAIHTGERFTISNDGRLAVIAGSSYRFYVVDVRMAG